MLGAIIGDLAGTKYEYQEFLDWKNGVINLERRRKILDLNEPLLTDKSFVSDDSILTIAIAEAILNKEDYGEVLKRYGRKYENKPLEREGFFKSAFSPRFYKMGKCRRCRKQEKQWKWFKYESITNSVFI